MSAGALLGRSVVEAGARVRLRDDDGENVLAIVDPAEADVSAGRISSDSPLGQAVLGRAVGDQVEVRAPAGRRAVRIVAIVGEVGG